MSETPGVDPYGTSQDPETALASQRRAVQLTGSKHAAYRVTGERGTPPTIRSAIYLMIAGIVLLVVSSVVVPRLEASIMPASGSVTVTGHVSDLRYVEGMCSPVVGFEADGHRYRAYSAERTNPCRYTIGDPVELSYLPSAPATTARLTSDLVFFGVMKIVVSAVTWALIIGGAVALVFGIGRVSRARLRWPGTGKSR